MWRHPAAFTAFFIGISGFMSNLKHVITCQKYFESLALNKILYKNYNKVNNLNFDPLQPNVALHIETSHLISFKNIMKLRETGKFAGNCGFGHIYWRNP